ncbi:beta-3 adrenergic receptor-like [Schistocerca piceifrons]|uniref:beta-3 adrenergic receptor-like n=1 Tax=Schistocerca piceifrons TaxID=274613 RepID=UPI001F5EC028|nr:beta-3 adrenergic receptor-like [Schistocerca piceifrons]
MINNYPLFVNKETGHCRRTSDVINVVVAVQITGYANKIVRDLSGDVVVCCCRRWRSVPALIVLCMVSLSVNARVLVSVCWIRRPLSPTLHISLSLAGADLFASAALATGLMLNSLFKALHLQQDQCLQFTVEALRLTGIIAAVAHLLALAANHYLGILRPLHYPAIMTHRNTSACIALLWLLPAAFFFVYFSSVPGQGYQSPTCNYDFLLFCKFRATFSSLFFGPLLLMAIIYAHIFVIVRRHQASRLRFSRRHRGSQRRAHHHHHAPHQHHHQHQHSNQQMARSVKAIRTTLLILGSYVIGLMPGVLVFVLVCADCPFPFPETPRDKFRMFFIYTTVNFLIILKTLLNPIIYAARMQEIKAATRRMMASARRTCRWCAPLLEVAGGAEESAGAGAGAVAGGTTELSLVRCASLGPRAAARCSRSSSANGSLRRPHSRARLGCEQL